MRRIAICICTLNRPQGLRRLLGAIDQQRLGKLVDAQLSVIVVDNSPAGSASGLVEAHEPHARLPVKLVHEPRKGLTYARNAALQAAQETGATYLAFIDDDEVPDPAWIESLVEGLDRSGADIGVGPVRPIFESPPPVWLPIAEYGVRQTPGGGSVEDGCTGNVVLRLAAIQACGLQFDMRFNASGGEDVYFFKEAQEKGLRIAWIEGALTQSIVPQHRMSVGWLCRRWYRTGTTAAYLGHHNPTTAAGRASSLCRGTVRLLGGGIRVIASALHYPPRPDAMVASLFTLCRGAGLIANAFGREYREYARSDYR